MSSPITSSDFEQQTPGQSLCDAFQDKLLNNSKIRSLLDYFFRDADGKFETTFVADLLAILNPVGSLTWTPKALDASVANPDNGSVWLEANGQKVLQSDYPRLFAFYGVVFNQDGDNAATEFRVPDMSGKFPLTRSGDHAVGTTGGEERHKLTTEELPNSGLKMFTDEDVAGDNDPAGNKYVSRAASSAGGDHDYRMQPASDGKFPTKGQTAPMGLGNEHNNMPPYFSCVAYVLAGYKVNGVMA